MPCEARAQNDGIAVRLRVDAEVDGGPALPINHHSEFDYLQPKALHIGEKLGRRRKRIRCDGPEGDRRSATSGRWHWLISSAKLYRWIAR
ncbi:hypothetical protein [Bradyrhizobium paxllaeri]|uniref:hypothetical protein n=1 Tax=Bradyrhizobium paxllaeri TaxID=190148 RepID=UPI000810DDC7|nr:hypothetical protein [Bradyrhizobium paxllaeri]